MELDNLNGVNATDNFRSSYRVQHSGPKSRVYCRKPYYIFIAKNVIKSSNFKIIDEMNKEQQFIELENYVNNCHQSELRNFGESFPFKSFLHFIRNTNNVQQKFSALKILSRVTMSGEAPEEFFLSPNLIMLCNHLINDEIYSPFILTILINGAEYEDFGNLLLNQGICSFLMKSQVTPLISQLVSNLTWFKSVYLTNLLEIILYILNDQIGQKDVRIDYSICCYAFKAIHHIYNWGNIDPSIIEEMNENFTPIFYTLAPLLLNTDNKRVLNTIFRYLAHLTNVPLEFGNLILGSIKDLKNIDKISEAKTIELAMAPFIINAESWIQEYKEIFLVNVFTNYINVPYNVKLIIFKAILLYYDCSINVIDQFMPMVIDWCLIFVEDHEVTKQALQMLLKILSAVGDNEEIISIISSRISIFEDLVISDKTDDESISLAENLIEVLKNE